MLAAKLVVQLVPSRDFCLADQTAASRVGYLAASRVGMLDLRWVAMKVAQSAVWMAVLLVA